MGRVVLSRMLETIRSWFSGGATAAEDESTRTGSVEGAAAALMIEAATLDGTFDDSERAVILRVLRERFDVSEADAEALLSEGRRAADDSTQIYDVIRVIRDALDAEERVKVIEVLWEVAYADGEVHDYEANLVRRVAGLLYVPDRDSGAARKRVLDRLEGRAAGQS